MAPSSSLVAKATTSPSVFNAPRFSSLVYSALVLGPTGVPPAFLIRAANASRCCLWCPWNNNARILKEIVADSGSMVCERGDQVLIDGVVRGHVAQRDHNGVPLPHWAGCRQLHSGEYFALSNRIPNSFDSRYYGPVKASDILGVYAPVWTE